LKRNFGAGISGYHACNRGGTSHRNQLTNTHLLTPIRAEVKGTYGNPRMAEEIHGRGVSASKGRVALLL
jgi:hypothetical protein